MFESLFKFVEQITQQNIATYVSIFTTTITPLIGACVVLYAIWLTYQALYEPENMIIMESVKFMGALALCTTIAFSTTWYLSKVVPMIYYSGDDIAKALLGSTGSGTLQTMFDTMLDQFDAVWGEVNFSWSGSWSTPLWFALLSLLILLGYIPFLLIATAYLLVAKIMVSFLLILGPLFIMFAFFPTTRSMFQSWTGQCFNYMLLTIVYPLAFTLFSTTTNTILLGGTREIGISTALMTIIVFGGFILISVQIPVFCSSLSGGMGINGLVGNMGAGLRTISSLTRRNPKTDDPNKNNGNANGRNKIKPG